jgi:hypothetical protein
MLEASSEITHGARKLGLDAVASTARRRRVMRFVKDQQASRQEWPEPFPHWICISRVDQQVVRDEEATMGSPRVHPKTPIPADLCEVGTVEDLEDETKAFLELRFPLLDNGRRRRNNYGLRLLAQEQLARDEASLNRLAEAGVVGDEEVDTRQPERLAQRLHLVSIDFDPRPERRLEEVGSVAVTQFHCNV